MGFFGFGSTAIRSTVITGKLALARFSVQRRDFKGGFFLGLVQRPYVQPSSPGRQKGSRLVAEEWVGGGMDGRYVRYGWAER